MAFIMRRADYHPDTVRTGTYSSAWLAPRRIPLAKQQFPLHRRLALSHSFDTNYAHDRAHLHPRCRKIELECAGRCNAMYSVSNSQLEPDSPQAARAPPPFLHLRRLTRLGDW